MKFRIFIVWILMFGFSNASTLSSLDLPSFYLNVGSRPQALGGAFVAVSDDGNSCFYNPGGLPWSKGIMAYVKDQSNISAAQAYPTGYGSTLGIAIAQTSMIDLTNTTTQTADLGSNFIILSAASNLSAVPLLDRLPGSQNIGVGLNFKSIFGQTLKIASAADKTASGWEIDLGLMYKALPWLNIGSNVQNIMPTGKNVISGGLIRWGNGETESVPLMINSGISAKIIGDTKSPIYIEGNEAALIIDSRMQRGKTGAVAFGVEWGYRGALFLRGGSFYDANLSNTSTTSLGIGFRAGGLGIDLSYSKDRIDKKRAFTFSFLYEPEEWAFEKKPETKKYEKLSIIEPITDLSPSDEVTTYDERIIISGKVKPHIEAAVNGLSVLQDDRGNFSAMVPLNSGKNLILIDLTYGDGRATIMRKVLRKPKIIIAEEKKLEAEIKKEPSPAEKEKLKKEFKNIQKQKQKVEALVTMGVIDVVPEAEFSLQAPVKRGELATWLVKASGIPIPRVSQPVFSDVAVTHPQAPFIKAAVDHGIMRGVGDKFLPDKPVTKLEAEEIFKRFGVIR